MTYIPKHLIDVCEVCGGEGRFIIDGPDHLGRDGNCWRDGWDEVCANCNGTGLPPDPTPTPSSIAG